MAKLGSHKHRQTFCEINITPLTDIFLVLLTIMIVVAPFVRQMRADIRLPEVVSGTEVHKDQITVDVNAEGKYFVNNVDVGADRLATVLRDKSKAMAAKKLIIQADRKTKSRAILHLIREAQDAQFEKVVVLGEASNTAQETSVDEESRTEPVR